MKNRIRDTEEQRFDAIDHGFNDAMQIDDEEEIEIKLGEPKNLIGNEVMRINDEQQTCIELEETNKMILVDHNHDYNTNPSRNKQFRAVYSRKRKGLNCSTFEKKHFTKKIRTSLRSKISDLNLGLAELNVVFKGPIVFVSPCSYISWFSCFVSLILAYMKNKRFFSWRRFSEFLLSDPTRSFYSSNGIRHLQDYTCDTSHGFFKIFGSVLSIPIFTVNFDSLPFSILYMHSSLLLKHAFTSYFFVMHPINENVTENEQSLSTTIVVKKARSRIKRVPRVPCIPLFKNCSSRYLPLPVVRKISANLEDKNVPFRRPDTYIRSKGDEIIRVLKTSWAVYDMDCGDEEWLMKFNNARLRDNDCVSEETFEKIIYAFEKGMFCAPDDYSDVRYAVDRCLKLASKEALERVYSYWMNKRKKKRDPLVWAFKKWHKKVRLDFWNVVIRKKRSFRKRVVRDGVEKELAFLNAILEEQKKLAELAIAIMKVHETQEAARRSEAAAMVKLQKAQALAETADLVTYKAAMALKIAKVPFLLGK